MVVSSLRKQSAPVPAPADASLDLIDKFVKWEFDSLINGDPSRIREALQSWRRQFQHAIQPKSLTAKGVPPGPPVDSKGALVAGWSLGSHASYMQSMTKISGQDDLRQSPMNDKHDLTLKGVPPGPPPGPDGTPMSGWSFCGWRLSSTHPSLKKPSFPPMGPPMSKTDVQKEMNHHSQKAVSMKGEPPGPPFNKEGVLSSTWVWRGWSALGGTSPSALRPGRGPGKGRPPGAAPSSKFRSASLLDPVQWKSKGRPPGPPPERKQSSSVAPAWTAPTEPWLSKNGTVKGMPPGKPPVSKLGAVKKMGVMMPPSKTAGGPSFPGKAGMTKKAIKVKAMKLPPVSSVPAPPGGWIAKAVQWSSITDKRLKKGGIWTAIQAIAPPSKMGAVDMVAAIPQGPPTPLEQESQGEPVPSLKSFSWDFGELTKLFFENPEDIRMKEERKRLDAEKRESLKSKQVQRLLDPQKGMNLEIGLKGLGLLSDDEPLWTTIRDLCFESTLERQAIDPEVLRVLMSLFPEGEDLGAMEKHLALPESERDIQLPPGENFVLKCLAIPEFILRANCCLVKLGFHDKIDPIKVKVDLLSRCSANVLEAFKVPDGCLTITFKALLDIGNYMNYGTRRGNAKGITLKSFESFRPIKSVTQSTTMYRYLINEMTRQFGDVFSLTLENALGLSIQSMGVGDFQEISSSIDALDKEVQKVRKQLDHPGLQDEVFKSIFSSWAIDSEAKLLELKCQLDEVAARLVAIVEVTNEKGSSPKDGMEALGLLSLLWRDLKHAIDENRLATKKNIEREERERKKELRELEKAERATKKAAEQLEKEKSAQERISRRDAREERSRAGPRGPSADPLSPLPTSRRSGPAEGSHYEALPTSRRGYKDPSARRLCPPSRQVMEDKKVLMSEIPIPKLELNLNEPISPLRSSRVGTTKRIESPGRSFMSCAGSLTTPRSRVPPLNIPPVLSPRGSLPTARGDRHKPKDASSDLFAPGRGAITARGARNKDDLLFTSRAGISQMSPNRTLQIEPTNGSLTSRGRRPKEELVSSVHPFQMIPPAPSCDVKGRQSKKAMRDKLFFGNADLSSQSSRSFPTRGAAHQHKSMPSPPPLNSGFTSLSSSQNFYKLQMKRAQALSSMMGYEGGRPSTSHFLGKEK